MGFVEGLQLLALSPVPDLDILAEAGGDGDQIACFGQDGLTANEKFARSGLGLDVKGDFDGRGVGRCCGAVGRWGRRREVADFDVEFSMATGDYIR